MRNSSGQPLGKATFSHVPLGAGGYVTGWHASGTTKVIRTDAFGAYVRSASDTAWRQLFTSTAIPSGLIHADHFWDTNYTDGHGCAEIVVAPSNNAIIFMNYDGYLLKSTDTGTTFANTGAPRKVLYANGPSFRTGGQTIAVDPNNASIILYGTQGQSVYYSTNGGTSFTDLSVAAGTSTDFGGTGQPSPHLVACDPTSTQVGGVRQRWVYSRDGVGIYESTSGPGGPYTLTSSGPTRAMRIKYDAFGNLWATQYGVVNNIWKKPAGGAWVNLSNTLSDQYNDVAVDPTNSNHIVAIGGFGHVIRSTNGGTSWPDNWNVGNSNNPAEQLFRSTSIRWLDLGPSQQWSPLTGQIDFDPSVSGRVWVPNGVGLHYCDLPASSASKLKWVEDAAGVEELVAHEIMVNPNGVALVGCHDQGIFRVEDMTRYVNPQKAPATIADTFASGGLHPFLVQPCTGLDYAADDPNWIACLHHGGFDSTRIANPHNGYSTDGGVTWNMFPALPPHKPYSFGGGSIAVGNAGNVIILWNGNGMPVYTKNSGTTWSDLPLPGIPADGVENGFEWQGNGFFLNKRMITYDKAGGAFYLFNYGPPTNTSLRGIWKSTTQGDSWTQVYSGAVTANCFFHTHLRSVPGQAGHLFFTAGLSFSDTLRRSTNGGVTWTDCTGIAYVTDIGFGKAAPGKTYPAIYFWGAVGGTFGLYRSDDNLATTVLLDSHPGGWLDYPAAVAGDLNTYGRVYLAMSSSGSVRGEYDFNLKLAA